jgi:hypothetical protein
VIIFSSDFSESSVPFHVGGVINRHFTDVVEHDFGHKWRLLGTLVNRYPNQQPFDFFFYKNARWEYDCKAKNGGEDEDDEDMPTYAWWLSVRFRKEPEHSPEGGCRAAERLCAYK